MLTVEKLKDFGANVEKGISRCAGSEALYLRLVGICVGELSSGELGEALAAGDLDRAFEIAHKLKGGVNNLELTPVAVPIGELTELLRNKTPGDYDKLYGDIVKETNALSLLME